MHLLELKPVPFKPFCCVGDLSLDYGRDLQTLLAGNRSCPTHGPAVDCILATRLASTMKTLSELLVLLKVGTGRKGKRFRHTNLLSLNAWSLHGQAERRFVTL